MDEDRAEDALVDDRDDQPELQPWYGRRPWKPIGIVALLFVLWIVIAIACPPSLWRF